jgi:hypothetical protein
MISPDHLAMLAASGITLEHAMARGYETIDDRRRLADLDGNGHGITPAGRNVPGLLVPMLRADGSTWGYQYRPDKPRLRDGKVVKYETPYQQSNGLDVPPGVGPLLPNPAIPLWITEGCKKADCGAVHGLCIVALSGVWNWLHTNSAGAKMAFGDWRDVALNGRRVIIAFDGDMARKESVQKAAAALSQYLAYKGARVEYLWLPDTPTGKVGLDDYLMTDGHSVQDLWGLIKPVQPPPVKPGVPPPPEPKPEPEPVQVVSLEHLHERFGHWFGAHYDLDAIDATLATAAVEKLTGDPLWMLIISGPGWAKTETVITLRECDGAEIVSTLTSTGALLSATAKRERTQDATGGLLRKMGSRGIMVLKDVTSILSLNPGMRAEIVAALREVYDGYWSRNVGTDGGRTLEWKGRIALVGAVTTAWDSHHAVVASMGDRFVLLRVNTNEADDRLVSGRQTIANTGAEDEMRSELARLAAGVLAGVDASTAPVVTEEEVEAILLAADLVTLARTACEFDYRGDVIDAHAPEAPTRFAKQLTQLFRGAVVIGMDRTDALRLAIRCARDSMPPLRLAIIDDLVDHPRSTTNEVRQRIDRPRSTVDRQLQALHALRVVTVDEQQRNQAGAMWWFYSLATGIDPTVLVVPEKSSHAHKDTK